MDEQRHCVEQLQSRQELNWRFRTRRNVDPAAPKPIGETAGRVDDEPLLELTLGDVHGDGQSLFAREARCRTE
jgi:hypothetical protein